MSTSSFAEAESRVKKSAGPLPREADQVRVPDCLRAMGGRLCCIRTSLATGRGAGRS